MENKSIKLFMAVKNDKFLIERFKTFTEIGSFGREFSDMDILYNANISHKDEIDCSLSEIIVLDNSDIVMSYDLYELFKNLISNNYILYDLKLNYSINHISSNNHVWSEDELNALKVLYPIYNTDVISTIIVDRSIDSIEKKAKTLGLTHISTDDSNYYEACKLKKKYIDIEVIENSKRDLSDTETVIDIMKNEYADKDISINSPEFTLSRFAIKYFSVDDIVEYIDLISLASTSSYIKPYQMVLYYTIYGRKDMFDYYNKNDPERIETFYRGLTYNKNNGSFRDPEKPITIFQMIVSNNPIEKAIDIVEFFLNQVNLNAHDFLTADKFIDYWWYNGFMKLMMFIDDDIFLDYVRKFKEEGIPEYSQLYDVLKYKQKDSTSISEDLNKVYSELLSDMIYSASDGDVYELFDIHSMLSTPFVIYNDLLQIMALSKYYSKMVLNNSCILSDDIDMENILHAFMVSSITNNIALAKILFIRISSEYKSLSSDTKDSISDIVSNAIDHFNNYGTRGVEKIFVIK